MKTKSLAALVLCATGCSSLRELPSTEELHVNKSIPHYFIQKSKEQGEKELSILAKKSDCEEGWIFYDNNWIECGISEKESRFNYDPIKLSFSLKNAIAYHIHPSKIYTNLEAQINSCEKNIELINKQLENQFITTNQRIDLIKSLLWETDQRLKNKAMLLSSRVFPSELDIYGSLDTNLKAYSVVSENGVIEYYFKLKPKNKKEAFEFGKEYNTTAFIALFERSIPNSKDDVEAIDNVIKSLNQEAWIQFDFRPYLE